MPNELQDRKEKRILLAGFALLGMCVGGTVVADLLEDVHSETEKESQKKSAQEIAKSAVLLADAVLDSLEGANA